MTHSISITTLKLAFVLYRQPDSNIWSATIPLRSSLLSKEVYTLVYMDKRGQTIGKSKSFTLNDILPRPSQAESPSSMDSFVTISDDEKGEDSYTIIDNKDSSKSMSQSWDMANSIQCGSLWEKVQDQEQEENCHISEESEDEEETVSPSNVILLSEEAGTECESKTCTTEEKKHWSFEYTDHDVPIEIISPENKLMEKVDQLSLNDSPIATAYENDNITTVREDNEELATMLSEKEISSTLSQSAMMTDQDHITQAKARSMQKVNRDLLAKNTLLSGWLSEEKTKVNRLEQQLQDKEAEIMAHMKVINDLQEETTSLKGELAQKKSQVRNLSKIIEEKDHVIITRHEEIEYALKETKKAKKALQDLQTEMKLIQAENTILKHKNSTEHKEIQLSEVHHTRTRHRGGSRERGETQRERAITVGSGHYHHHSRARGGHQRKDLPRRVSSPPNDTAGRSPTSGEPTVIPDRSAAVRDSVQVLESLKQNPSAITRCPICNEVRPAHEDAMAMNVHIESCLCKQGFK